MLMLLAGAPAVLLGVATMHDRRHRDDPRSQPWDRSRRQRREGTLDRAGMAAYSQRSIGYAGGFGPLRRR